MDRATGSSVLAGGQAIHVLVATQAVEVCDILEARPDVQYDLVLVDEVIKTLLDQVDLVIIDYDHVGGSKEDKARLEEEVFHARKIGRVDEYSSEEFLANPEGCLGGMGRFGNMRRLPEHLCIAFVSYSGGTGRTTLALDTALGYAQTLKKYDQRRKKKGDRGAAKAGMAGPTTDTPAMLVEMTFGVSALMAITGVEMPALMRLATESEEKAQNYKGVDCVPMDYENVRVVAVDLLKDYFDTQIAAHSLTVVDAVWPHPLSEGLSERINLWVVTACQRPDTVSNAFKLAAELRAEFGEDKVWLLQNRTTKERERSSRRRRNQNGDAAGDSGSVGDGAGGDRELQVLYPGGDHAVNRVSGRGRESVVANQVGPVRVCVGIGYALVRHDVHQFDCAAGRVVVCQAAAKGGGVRADREDCAAAAHAHDAGHLFLPDEDHLAVGRVEFPGGDVEHGLPQGRGGTQGADRFAQGPHDGDLVGIGRAGARPDGDSAGQAADPAEPGLHFSVRHGCSVPGALDIGREQINGRADGLMHVGHLAAAHVEEALPYEHTDSHADNDDRDGGCHDDLGNRKCVISLACHVTTFTPKAGCLSLCSAAGRRCLTSPRTRARRTGRGARLSPRSRSA